MFSFASRLVVLFVAISSLLAALISPACIPPRPSPDGGVVETPSSWVSTTRLVTSQLRWAIPAAHAVTDAILEDPARTDVGRALDATVEATNRLDTVLSAYESHGGDRCAVSSAIVAVRVALVEVAQSLTMHGVAFGSVLERVADGVAQVVDVLAPSCQSDIAWSSSGAQFNATLRGLESAAAARGIALRRDLDRIREPQ